MAGVRLHKVEPTQGAGGSTSMDIVFMHGLEGHYKKTWQSPDQSGWWPQWAADALPHACILTLEYPAAIGGWTESQANAQPDAQSLADAIADAFRNQSPKLGSRPCVFVCHSLGGLLLKRVLVDAKNRSHDPQWFKDDRVAGILFLGTPHRGSAVANVLLLAEKIKNSTLQAGMIAIDVATQAPVTGLLNLLGLSRKSLVDKIFTSSELIKFLKEDSRDLQWLNEDFRSYWEERGRQGKSLHLRLYAEQLPTLHVQVVDKGSADPNLRGITVVELVGKDHITMVKPTGPEGEIAGALLSMVDSFTQTHGIFDFKDDTRNLTAQAVFEMLRMRGKQELLKTMADLLNVAPEDPYAIAFALVQLPHLEIGKFLTKVTRSNAAKSHEHGEDLEKLGMLLLPLVAPSHGGTVVLKEGAPPLLTVPDMSHESRYLFSELVHASFRNWAPLFLLEDDGVTLKPGGWRVSSPAVINPSGWTSQGHVDHVRDYIVASQLTDDLATSRSALAASSEEAQTAKYQPAHVKSLEPSFRLIRAKALLKRRFNEEMALIIEVEPSSPLRNEEVQRALQQEFDTWLTLLISDAENPNPQLDGEFQSLQVTVQGFLSNLKQTKASK